jgi:hypothetical protein
MPNCRNIIFDFPGSYSITIGSFSFLSLIKCDSSVVVTYNVFIDVNGIDDAIVLVRTMGIEVLLLKI